MKYPLKFGSACSCFTPAAPLVACAMLLMAPLQKKRVDSLTTPSVSRVLIFKTGDRASQYSNKNLQKTFRVWKSESKLLLYRPIFSAPSPPVPISILLLPSIPVCAFIFSFSRFGKTYIGVQAGQQDSNRSVVFKYLANDGCTLCSVRRFS
jgi:hypothetical protein